MSRRAVFLDRDGVINRAIVRDGRPYPPRDLSELEVLPGVPDALSRLSAEGFLLVVVTNQPDVARGALERSVVEEMNARLRETLPLDEVRVCYHDESDGCPCRKPAPGMILEAVKDHGIDIRRSYLVGDRWRDLEAGERAGCRTVFVDHGYRERPPDRCDFRVRSLSEAAEAILSEPPGGDRGDEGAGRGGGERTKRSAGPG